MKPVRLAIVAGDGSLPAAAFRAAQKKNWHTKLFCASNNAQTEGCEWELVSLARPIHLVWRLRRFQPDQICLIGGVELSQSERDKIRRVARILSFSRKSKRNSAPRSGDASLSKHAFLLAKWSGARLIGVHEIDENLAVSGDPHIAGPLPTNEQRDLARAALIHARKAGELDLGQAVVAASGRVLAVEDIQGTNALLFRVAEMRKNKLLTQDAKGLVVAKALKPHQPEQVDMPTIGPDTIIAAQRAGIGLIALQERGCLIADRETTVARANAAGITILAVDLNASSGHADGK